MNVLGWVTMPEWLIFGVTALVLLYKYITRYRNYWKQQGIPFEEFSFIRPFLNAYKPIHLQDEERYKKYGKLFGTFEGGKPLLMLSDVELMKHVLVKDFPSLPQRRPFPFHDDLLDSMLAFVAPKRWKTLRAACSPAFSAAKLRNAHAAMQSCAKVACENLAKAAESSHEMDIKNFFGYYTIDVIARCAFGTVVDSYNDKRNEFVQAARDVFGGDITLRKFLFVHFPSVLNALKIPHSDTKIFHCLKDIASAMMHERRRTGTRREDFLQMMIDAQEGTLSTTTEKEDTSQKEFHLDDDMKFESVSKGITEDEALAQCVIFLFAGLDTTSMALAFAAYLLTINPDAQERLRAEIDECFEKHGTEPSLDVVNKLQYLNGVVSESLRMYPVVNRIERLAHVDYTLGDSGVTVPKGCLIVAPAYSIHHDPENFPDPYKFDPTRFIGENLSSIRPYTYLPFGAGPLNCIGSKLALHALKLCLLHVLHRVEFVRTANTKVPIEFCAGFTTVTTANITIGIRKRLA
ncbi:cytochrome P450 3A41-like isoform X1 [Ornithodoros turicata]|uniref:cytochrome P450 3A41-like isoform X1 n=1 Tax=Ornithodoros turicata TaxID=34597 RepID=UPI003139D68C